MANAEITEAVEEEAKTPNKVVSWVKGHAKTIRDVALGAGAVGALVAIAHFGKSKQDDDPDDPDDTYADSDDSDSTTDTQSVTD